MDKKAEIQAQKEKRMQRAIEQESRKKTYDNYDELKKCKELLDIGAITQEDYDRKKKQLLDM